jgi:hypothetical protein
MAKSKKTKSAKAKTKAKSSWSDASAASKKSTDAFANSSNFFNPQQFFNLTQSQWPNFQPANLQQLAEQWIATSQKNIETLTACTQMAAERVKDMMEEQANFASRIMQETSSTVQEALSSDADPKEKLEEIADYTKYFLEKTATYARKTAEDNIQTAQKIGSTLSKRLTDSVDEMSSAA